MYKVPGGISGLFFSSMVALYDSQTMGGDGRLAKGATFFPGAEGASIRLEDIPDCAGLESRHFRAK
jgi:hypothetical protein